MKRFLAAALAALACVTLAPLAAIAQVATPYQVGQISAATNTRQSVAVFLSIPADVGDVIWVVAESGNNISPQSATDASGVPYQAGVVVTNGARRVRSFYRVVETVLPVGSEVSVDFGTITGAKVVSVAIAPRVRAPSAAALDLEGAGATGSSATPSISTGMTAEPGSIALAYTFVQGAAGTPFGEAPGFTTLHDTGVLETTTGGSIHTAYRLLSSTEALTYAPTLPSSLTWTSNIIVLKPAISGPTPARRKRLGLGGVGE